MRAVQRVAVGTGGDGVGLAGECGAVDAGTDQAGGVRNRQGLPCYCQTACKLKCISKVGGEMGGRGFVGAVTHPQ